MTSSVAGLIDAKRGAALGGHEFAVDQQVRFVPEPHSCSSLSRNSKRVETRSHRFDTTPMSASHSSSRRFPVVVKLSFSSGCNEISTCSDVPPRPPPLPTPNDPHRETDGARMDFELDDDQRELQDTVRGIVDKECSPSFVRTVIDDGIDPAGWWATMVELDWPALAIAEEHGGLGMGWIELAILLEELGRANDPSPFVGTTTQFAPAITHCGDADQRARWLGGVAVRIDHRRPRPRRRHDRRRADGRRVAARRVGPPRRRRRPRRRDRCRRDRSTVDRPCSSSSARHRGSPPSARPPSTCSSTSPTSRSPGSRSPPTAVSPAPTSRAVSSEPSPRRRSAGRSRPSARRSGSST